MKRAHVLVVVGDSAGGGTWVALEGARALDPARYQVTLVAPQAETLARACATIGVTYAPLPLLDSRVGRDVIARLSALIAVHRFDIIHAHGTRAAWFVSRCLPARGGPPLIYSEHLLSFEARRGVAQLPWRGLELYLCRRADYMTTSCERNARFAQVTHRRAITVRHYGVDVAAIQRQARQVDVAAQALPPDAPLIGSVGRLIPQKGLRYLIAAAPDILRAHPSARFVIVGDGPEQVALEAQCRAAGLAERFHFTGALEQPWATLARCDVIALPSLWEGLPLTLLEALAVGLPVVATTVGGAPEALRPPLSAGLIPSRHSGALAHAVNRLLGDVALRERFQRVGPEVAARYDIHATRRAFAALYDEALGVSVALSQADV